MHPVKPCRTYHGVVTKGDMLRGRDGKTAFKVYFVDVVGRPAPSRTEWASSGLDRAERIAALVGTDGMEGVGFITAFPHITKAFRFAPENEIVLNVRAWSTPDLSPIDLARPDGYVEFACLAEALVAADEYRFWAEAESVAEYLARWSDVTDAPVHKHDKLLDHWK